MNMNQRSLTLIASIKDFAWSKDGKYFSFLMLFNEYENDWVIDIPGKKRRFRI